MPYISELKDVLAGGFHIIIFQQCDGEFVFLSYSCTNCDSMGQGYI